MKTSTENITKYSEVKRQTVHRQTELSYMSGKKNLLNEINKEGTFTQGFTDCRYIKRKVCHNLDYLQNLLIKLTVKVNSEKAWLGLLYEFSFSLNPGDKPHNSQAWKNYSSLYPVNAEDQFEANSKKNCWNILEAAK